MTKDPAFLFYPNDWLGGTMTLTRHQKGCYMDLLLAQFNSGPLSLEMIKTLLGTDQAVWTVLQAKFKQDVQGRFFNERMATEIKKRKEFAEKQAERIKKRWDKYHGNTAVLPIIENEDRNENEDENITGMNKTWKPLFKKWIDYRRSIKKPLKQKSLQSAFNRLLNLSGGIPSKAEELIEYNISNGYQGMFAPLKNDLKTHKTTVTQQWMD